MRKYVIIFFLIILLLVVSCGRNSGNNRSDVALQIGTSGLKIEFMKNTPKETMEEGKAYITFELRNEGFYDIKKGVIVSSLEEDFMRVEEWELPPDLRLIQENMVSFDLQGKTLTNLKGGKQVASMIVRTKEIDETRNKMKSMIVLNACYPYETILSNTICIDTDPNGLSIAEKTCKTEDITSSAGQGAPIAITKVEQKMIPGNSKDSIKVQFTIYAENRGGGIIIDEGRYEDICLGKGLTIEDYNTIRLKNIRFSDYEKSDMDCTPDELRETKNAYYIRCTLKDENSVPKNKLTFETPLVIELSYGYKSTISEDIEILSNEQQIK